MSPANKGQIVNLLTFSSSSYSDLESRMKDELMNVKIKFTEQSARLAELKQEVSRLETKVRNKPVKEDGE